MKHWLSLLLVSIGLAVTCWTVIKIIRRPVPEKWIPQTVKVASPHAQFTGTQAAIPPALEAEPTPQPAAEPVTKAEPILPPAQSVTPTAEPAPQPTGQ